MNLHIVFKQLLNLVQRLKKLCGLPPGSTVAIVGAGLSGIELASELRESRSDLNIKLFDRSASNFKRLPRKVK